MEKIISVVSKSVAIENYLFVILCFMIIPMISGGIELLVMVWTRY